jgi:uncharacterized protein (TIGR03437 family)
LVNSANPATAGVTVLQIYCTGLGPVTNQPASGSAASITQLSQTTAAPTVTIGGAPATVLFSGLAPGSVGEYQVDALVPATSSKGGAVPVIIAIGGVTSNTVTITVQRLVLPAWILVTDRENKVSPFPFIHLPACPGFPQRVAMLMLE